MSPVKMKYALPLFCLLMLSAFLSCEKETVSKPFVNNGLEINGDLMTGGETVNSYYTKYGVIHAYEFFDGKLWLVFCAADADEYEFTNSVLAKDTITAGLTPKAFAIFEYQGKTYRSKSGKFEKSEGLGEYSGWFNIEFENGPAITTGNLTVNNRLERPYKLFKDVQLTDENGLPLNSAPGAWKMDEEWSALEWSYFEGEHGTINTSGALVMHGTYPNPIVNDFMLAFYADKNPELYFVLINDNYEVMLEYFNPLPFSAGDNNLSLDATSFFGLTSGDTFRMYYILKSEDGYIKGHGDIMVN
ncbi:MAG: hypothetical protein R2769_10675 [Saprospiraceae bacterium]